MAGTRKPFDIIIGSKYTPEGVRKALRDLKSIGEAGFFIQQGFVHPLQAAAGTILDLIGAANPERIKALQDAFDGIRSSIGQLLDQVLGPTIDELSRLINQATLLSNAEKNLAPVYDDLIKRLKERKLSAREMAEEIRKASDSAVQAAQREKEANPFHFIGVNARDFAIQSEQFRQAVLDSSKSLEEYIEVLRRSGVEIKNLNDEVQRFAQAKGIKFITPGDVVSALKGSIDAVAQTEKRLTDTRAQSALARSRLLEDIALREADRLADIARQNAQAVAEIDAQRVEALSQASADLAQQLADIERNSARDRLRIEEQFQDRLQQIKRSSDESIEEAIRRRDARALAQALRQRREQISDAERDRDKALRDQAEAVAQQRAQAQQQAEEQRKAAEDAARQAVAELDRRNREAAAEAKRGYDRQLRDFDIATGRREEDIKSQNEKEVTLARRHFKRIEKEYKDHLERIEDLSRVEAGPLAQALSTFVIGKIEEALAVALTGTPTGTPSGRR